VEIVEVFVVGVVVVVEVGREIVVFVVVKVD